jgi:cob(I)alamin adenosyltransferase
MRRLMRGAKRPARLRSKMFIRLSDFLFVAARYTSAKGAADILWVAGRTR